MILASDVQPYMGAIQTGRVHRDVPQDQSLLEPFNKNPLITERGHNHWDWPPTAVVALQSVMLLGHYLASGRGGYRQGPNPITTMSPFLQSHTHDSNHRRTFSRSRRLIPGEPT